ncbi:hypothetical protein LCGC14_2517510, partial [marine sediment metagenome]
LQPAALQSGGGGGFDFSSLAGLIGGGGGGNFSPMMGIGDLFSQLNEQVYGSIGDFPYAEFVTNDPVTSSYVDPNLTRLGFTPGSPEAIAATQAEHERLLAASGSGSTQTLHAGGRLKPGQSGIVGDDPQGRLTPFSELVRNVNGEVEITPLGGRGLSNFRGGFDTGTGPHSHQEMVDAEGNPIVSEVNPFDVVPDVPFPTRHQ